MVDLFWKLVGFVLYQSFDQDTIDRKAHNRYCNNGVLVIRGMFCVYGQYPCRFCEE